MLVLFGGGNLSTDSPGWRQKHFQSALRKLQRFTGSLWAETFESWWRYEWGPVLWSQELSQNTSVWQSVVLAEIRQGQVWLGADNPSVRGKTGCFLWFVQQSKVVGCCAGVQAFTVRRCFVATAVDVLAVEVTNVNTGVWEHRDGRRCESRAWRFVDVNDLISCDVYTQPLSLRLLCRLINQ